MILIVKGLRWNGVKIKGKVIWNVSLLDIFYVLNENRLLCYARNDKKQPRKNNRTLSMRGGTTKQTHYKRE